MENTEPRNWDIETCKTRIADPDAMIRFEAGSPNPEEVDCYRKLLLKRIPLQTSKRSRVLILGMTPELRRMALEIGAKITSVDRSADAIAVYSDWIQAEYRSNEQIICSEWLQFEHLMNGYSDAILGDGVFPNVLSINEHHELLTSLKHIIHHESILIFRQVIIPYYFDLEENSAPHLLNRFRAGSLSEAEFGFGMRFWGCFDEAYDPESFLLNNRIIYDRYLKWLKQERLSQAEFDCIYRYYFDGMNMILPQKAWEEILRNTGFSFECHTLKGNSWYEYYPIYSCQTSK